MKSALLLLSIPALAVVGIAAAGPAADQPAAKPASVYNMSFDDVKAGELPTGWKAEATNSMGEVAEWKVVADEKAPSKPNVLSITKITDTSGGHFNLFWTNDVQFKDGTLQVKVRADTGKQDQGGGLIWRATDAKNYYVARYNPLEANFRLYYVKEGRRTQLADAGNLEIKTGEWFTMKIVVNGDRMEGYVNGKKLLEATDKTFPDAGGVGLWSKADAAASFDDFVAVPARPAPTATPASVR